MNSPLPAAPITVSETTDRSWRPVPQELSAERTTTAAQRTAFAAAAGLLALACAHWSFLRISNGLNEFVLAFYGLVLLHRAAALLAGAIQARRLADVPADVPADTSADTRGAESEPPALAAAAPGLPLISILVPLYHEGDVIPQIVGAIGRLQYPPDRIEVLLLLEEDDTETRSACEQIRLPAHFRAVVVPPGVPRTKPRACNYGLWRCRGAVTVIYDAEDQPEPDQLLKAAARLAASPPDVACLQAGLAYYNPRQNILSGWFAAEYLSWFDLMLPGLYAIRSPIPLGGTSNFFRTSVLRNAGGWDAWNVTEDCDVGIRLYRAGFKVGILNSTTWEEACPEVRPWIRQRSRWVKGYLQTWLVHSRHPIHLWRDLGGWGFLNMQLLVGGSVLCLLLNPIYWLLTLLWWTHPTAAESALMGGPTLLLGNVSWTIGNLLFIVFHSAGAVRRKQWRLVWLGLLVPIYWLMMSVAAWKALLQLLTAPHHWEKTPHGLAHMPPADALPPGE